MSGPMCGWPHHLAPHMAALDEAKASEGGDSLVGGLIAAMYHNPDFREALSIWNGENP